MGFKCHIIQEYFANYGLLGPYYSGKICKIWAFRVILFREFCKICITVPLFKKKNKKNSNFMHS
jgi:hypothetical protein